MDSLHANAHGNIRLKERVSPQTSTNPTVHLGFLLPVPVNLGITDVIHCMGLLLQEKNKGNLQWVSPLSYFDLFPAWNDKVCFIKTDVF